MGATFEPMLTVGKMGDRWQIRKARQGADNIETFEHYEDMIGALIGWAQLEEATLHRRAHHLKIKASDPQARAFVKAFNRVGGAEQE